MTRLFAAPADLHMHSACSDGTQTPTDLVSAAAEHGLRTIALTDHDTTQGWAEAATATQSHGMTLIPGMELSTRADGRSVHMLGYLFNPDDAGLTAELEKIRADRLGRAERIVHNISADFPLTWEDVLGHRAEGATIGRPHIADALITRGIVSDRAEAFAGILNPRQGYTVPLYAPHPREGVRLIREAGGVAVMAHPSAAGRQGMMPISMLEDLIAVGLGGFEIEHRENSAEGKVILRELAARHDLIVTGSSDYHGAGKPNLPGENITAEESVARIIERATGTAPIYPA